MRAKRVRWLRNREKMLTGGRPVSKNTMRRLKRAYMRWGRLQLRYR